MPKQTPGQTAKAWAAANPDQICNPQPETCIICPNPATTNYDDLPLCDDCLNAILEPDPSLCPTCGQPFPEGEDETLIFITRECPPPGASYAAGIGIRW